MNEAHSMPTQDNSSLGSTLKEEPNSDNSMEGTGKTRDEHKSDIGFDRTKSRSDVTAQNSSYNGEQNQSMTMLGLSSSNMPSTLNGVSAGALNAALSAVSKASVTANSSYRDFSRVPVDNHSSENAFVSTTSSGKDPPFPVKLHRILSNPEFRDYIMWLPHGRSWRVLKPKAFEEKVIPLYFRHAKYASFMRQVNGWGFKRMTQGPDHNSYYHELFLRGLPHICMKMRRPAKAKSSGNDVETNPDFYRMSMVAPLPNSNDNASLGAVQTQDILAGITNAGAVTGPSPSTFAGLQNALVLPNSNISAPGFNMGMVGANPSVGNFDPSSLTSATELLQQHIQNQLQQGLGNQLQQGNAIASQQVNGTQNSQVNGISSNNDSSISDSKNTGEPSDNLEVIKQRMKERSELVRQLKEVMDASAPGDNNNPTSAQATIQQTSEANAVVPSISGNILPGSAHAAQFQQMIPTVGHPQMQQMMTQFNPASGLIPGMGMGALGLGQFPNAMMGGGMGMLGINGQLLAQPNFIGGGVVGAPVGIQGVMNNPLTNPAAGAGFQNFNIMAMQNPAVLAQLQAANQMGNVQAAVNLYHNQQVPDLGAKQVNQTGAATS